MKYNPKTFYLLLTFFFLNPIIGSCGVTINPSCYSNAYGFRIDKIDNSSDGAYVYLSYYRYKSIEYWVPANFYIENYNNVGGKKLYIKEFFNNSINQKYQLNAYTRYDFVFKFESIPFEWKNINLVEGPVNGAKSFYWNYISLNRPESERLYFDNLFLIDGIEVLAKLGHPLNNYSSSRYTVDKDKVRIQIYYKEGYTLELCAYISGKYIKEVAVMYDDDYDRNKIWPFSSLQLIRDYIFKQNNNNENISFIENLLGKYINSMNGEELTAAFINLVILTQK